MELVTVRDLRLRPGRVWQRLGKAQPLVVTSNGRPIAVMAGVEAGDLEETLKVFHRLQLERTIDRMQEHARARGLDNMTMAEINAIIHDVRRSRRRRR